MDDQTIYANLFIGNTAGIPMGNDTIVIKQETNYPWKDEVSFTFDPQKASDFTFAIRIPGWTRNIPVPGGLYGYLNKDTPSFKISINDQSITDPKIIEGYIRLTRKWNPGDKVNLQFDMPVRKVIANQKVKADSGYVAIMRGPVVYCLESKDNTCSVFDITLRGKEALTPEPLDSLLHGTYSLTGVGHFRDSLSLRVRLIPYFLWDNRGKSDMTIWTPLNWTKEIADRQEKISKAGNDRGNTDG
jgi:DUF1680 family protein